MGKGTLTLKTDGQASGQPRQKLETGRPSRVVKKKSTTVLLPVQAKKTHPFHKQPPGNPKRLPSPNRKQVQPTKRAPDEARQLDREDFQRRADALRAAKAEEAQQVLERQRRDRQQLEIQAREEKERLAKEEENRGLALDEQSLPVDVAEPAQSEPKPVDRKAAADKPKNEGTTKRGKRSKGRSSGEEPARFTETKKRGKEKFTPNAAIGDDDGVHQKSRAAYLRREERRKRQTLQEKPLQPREKIIRDVQLPETIVVQELANRMSERSADVVKKLMENGIMATQNQTIDAEVAEIVIVEFGHNAVRVADADVQDVIESVEDKPEDLKPRDPVVAVMGHVDHGKTTLLDTIRKTSVAASEDGGITQHIGAYQVTTDAGRAITFLDTPGHAAFTSMRERGANVTDIAIIVVAADDSVMPQTIEAINHAKAAEAPIIVAINKCDRPNADPDKVRNQLLQHGIIVERLSGDVLDVEISALKGDGIDELLEAITLQAELIELSANPNRVASGTVIEAQLDVGRGSVATVLVQHGTLKKGDVFVVGEQWGKIRALINDNQERVESAGPSVPVEVLGLNGTPMAGDVLNVVDNESQAREIAKYRTRTLKNTNSSAAAILNLENMMQGKSPSKELQLVVKTDVQGSSEAITQALSKVGNDEVQVRILHSGVGAITESDVSLAASCGANVIGFNVRGTPSARSAASKHDIDLRYYSVIYRLVDDVKALASGLLDVQINEIFLGNAKILETFKITGVGVVAGCLVTEGTVKREAGVRLIRDNVVIHEGKLKTLKRFQDEVSEVVSGQECGMAFENYANLKIGDFIEVFDQEEIEQAL